VKTRTTFDFLTIRHSDCGWLVGSFICSFVRLFVHSFIRSFVRVRLVYYRLPVYFLPRASEGFTTSTILRGEAASAGKKGKGVKIDSLTCQKQRNDYHYLLKMKLTIVCLPLVLYFTVWTEAVPLEKRKMSFESDEVDPSLKSNINRGLYEVRERDNKLTPMGGKCWKNSECVPDSYGKQYCSCYPFHDGGECVACETLGVIQCKVKSLKSWCLGKKKDVQ